MSRRISRRKKTAWFVVGMGLASGAVAVILWPYLQRLGQTPLITVGIPTVKPAPRLGALLRG